MVDKLQLAEKGNFEEIYEEKESCTDPEKVLLFHSVDKRPDRVDRPGCVCEHRRDTDEKATEPSKEAGVGKVFKKFAMELPDELKNQHEKDDEADDASGGLLIQSIEKIPGTDDRGKGHRDERPNHFPARVFAEKRVNENVAGDEHGQDDADAVFGAEEFGDEEDVDDGETGESGLGDAKAEGTQAGESKGKTGGFKRHFHEFLP